MMSDHDRSFYLQCRVCRHPLIKDVDLKDCKGCFDSSVWYVDEDVLPKWILETVEKEAWQKGKLYCKKCNGRLGSFNFIKVLRCTVCESHDIPPIHILRDRVDKKVESPIPQNDLRQPVKVNAFEKETPNAEDELSFPNIDNPISEDLETFPDIDNPISKYLEKEKSSTEIGCSNLPLDINDAAFDDMSACNENNSNNISEVINYSSRTLNIEDEDNQQGPMESKAGCDNIPVQDFTFPDCDINKDTTPDIKFPVCKVPNSCDSKHGKDTTPAREVPGLCHIENKSSPVDSGIGFTSILHDLDTTDEHFEFNSRFDFGNDLDFEPELDKDCFQQKFKHTENEDNNIKLTLKDNEKGNQMQPGLTKFEAMRHKEIKNDNEDLPGSSAGAHFCPDIDNCDSEPKNALPLELVSPDTYNFEAEMKTQRNTRSQMPRQQDNIFNFFLNEQDEDIINENNFPLRDVQDLSYEELRSTLNGTPSNGSQDDLLFRENLDVDQDDPIGSEEGEVSLNNRYMLFSNERQGRKGRRRTRVKREKRRQEKQTKYSEYTDQIHYDSFLIEYPEEHVCPICYDLLCEPHSCLPCDHVMCEPCLRRVGQNMVYRTPCPLCRQPIVECVRKKDMISLLVSLYPSEYRERKRNQRKYLNDKFSPLPHRAQYLNHTNDDIRNHILNQRGQRRVDRMTYFLKMKLLLGGLLLLFFMIPVASLMRSCVNSTIGLVRNLWR